MEGLIVDTDTFVIVGAWNREILSQEWVMQNLRRRWKRRFVALLTDVTRCSGCGGLEWGDEYSTSPSLTFLFHL